MSSWRGGWDHLPACANLGLPPASLSRKLVNRRTFLTCPTQPLLRVNRRATATRSRNPINLDRPPANQNLSWSRMRLLPSRPLSKVGFSHRRSPMVQRTTDVLWLVSRNRSINQADQPIGCHEWSSARKSKHVLTLLLSLQDGSPNSSGKGSPNPPLNPFEAHNARAER